MRRATPSVLHSFQPLQISIHALLAESDGGFGAGSWRLVTFLSTLSLRRATAGVSTHCETVPHFYPRSPCGERLDDILAGVNELLISIHALLAESDLADCTKIYAFGDFYPRSPCGERHLKINIYTRVSGISIHALLAESDLCHHISKNAAIDFYPRSPCGERLTSNSYHICTMIFLSTLSLRRATLTFRRTEYKKRISIHALLAESDSLYQQPVDGDRRFLSTLSLRRATNVDSHGTAPFVISIHALLAESDSTQKPTVPPILYFYPRSPCGERRAANGKTRNWPQFLSTLSLRRATVSVLV